MLAPDEQAPPPRLAELVGALSLATDLADGFAAEKCLRTAIVAVRLAQLVKAGPDVTRLCFWAGVLRFVGCTAFAHEEGRSFAAGDDIGLRQAVPIGEAEGEVPPHDE